MAQAPREGKQLKDFHFFFFQENIGSFLSSWGEMAECRDAGKSPHFSTAGSLQLGLPVGDLVD